MLTYLPYGKTHLPIEAPAERIMVSRVDDIPKAESGDAVVENVAKAIAVYSYHARIFLNSMNEYES